MQCRNAEVIRWIRSQAACAKAVASICTGAFLLAEAGLLDGKMATTHWEDIKIFRESYPATQVIEHARFIDNDRVLTAAGIASGIDLALHLCSRFFGVDVATAVARQMEYPWYGPSSV
jgi:transcriptional regulator GlxA family with amidase domain